MSFVVVAPDSTVYNGGVLTGGATLHAVLADLSTASYVTKAQYSPPDKVSMTAPVKPAGSVTKQVRLSHAASSISVNSTRLDSWLEYGGVQYGNISSVALSGTADIGFQGPWVNVGDLTAAQIGDIVIAMQRSPSGGSTSGRYYTSRLDVIFAEIPTVAITAPASGAVLASSSFTATWVHTPGADGGSQSHYLGRVYSAAQYGASGFNPDTSAPTLDTGTVTSASSSHGFTGLASGTYRLYVKTAQSVNGAAHWSAWAFIPFTVVPGSTSEVSTVTPTADSLNGAITVAVAINAATDTADYVEVERSVDTNLFTSGDFTTGAGGIGTGWTASADVATPTATSRSLQTTGGISGQFQRMGATLDDGDAFGQSATERVPITPGEGYSVQFMAKGTFPANTVLRCYLTRRNASGGLSVNWLTWQDESPSSSWRTFTVERVAEADQHTVEVKMELVGLTGAAAAVTAGDFDLVRVFTGGIPEWALVRGATDVPVVADAMSVADFEASPDTEIRYRARAVKSLGPVAGAWIYSTATTWTPAIGIWLKSPTNPNLNVELCPADWPGISESRQVEWFDLLGQRSYGSAANALKGYSGSIAFETVSKAELDELLAILAEPVVLIHAATGFQLRPFWASLGEVRRAYEGVPGLQVTTVQVAFSEIAAP